MLTFPGEIMRLMLLATFFALSPALVAAPQGDAVSIEGKVRRLGTGEPIPNVQVSIIRPLPNATPTDLIQAEELDAVTDATGRFSFKNLLPGRYNLHAQRDGYFGVPVNGTALTIVTKVITIEAGKPVPNSDITMIQG